MKARQPVKLHGVDVRIMNEEQAWHLNRMKMKQDLFRLNVLRELGITPFVIPFRDYANKRTPTQYERDLARWANRMWLFKSTSFEDYTPRKGFKCGEYLK